jgi:hypothetical protein
MMGLRIIAAFLLGFGLHLCLRAQVASNPSTTTLNVYTNLIQIPVLVSGNSHVSQKQLDTEKFAVSLDSGPPFPIKHVRLEGDDPITLSIVLDLSGDQSRLLSRLDEAISGLANGPLALRDRVSVYAVDCKLEQFADDVPANAAQLKDAVDRALYSTSIHGNKIHPNCRDSLHLWDALTEVTKRLGDLPGRLVILAITDGHDKGSKSTWTELRILADYAGVAIFGLGSNEDSVFTGDTGSPYENKFSLLCRQTGGDIDRTDPRSLAARLNNFANGLRHRVIIEFPRPDNLSAKAHDIAVTLTNKNGFTLPSNMLRPSGFSVPIADPAMLADPHTIPNNPANAPTVGKRGILTPSH